MRFFPVIFALCTSAAAGDPGGFILSGSTPGDEPVKSLLSIPVSEKVDFIRWRIQLDAKNNFTGEIHYGESKPNTLGFINDGKRKNFSGSFTRSAHKGSPGFKEIYLLRSSALQGTIALGKINNNLFHLLTTSNRLMKGNGGWSYTFNREQPVSPDAILVSPANTQTKSLREIYEGRTPCREFAADHPEMKVHPDCFKLKWRLILDRDSASLKPSTYTIRKVVNNEPQDISGKWTIRRGTRTNPDAVIYTIDPEDPARSISWLVGDENILFFLDNNDRLYSGNKDFSFTLNRKW